MHRKSITHGLMALLLVSAPVLHGATITVTTTTDELDGASGNGECALREAVVNANANDQSGSVDCAAGEAGPGVVDEIVFASSLDGMPVGLTITGAGEDLAQTGDLDITDTLTIRGRGGIASGIPVGSSPSARTEITANTLAPYDRVFHLHNNIQATLEQLWITDGGNVAKGGGIKSELGSSLVLTNVLVSNNRVSGDSYVSGGGINAGGKLVLEYSAVFNNIAETTATSSTAEGGGIRINGSGRITQSYVGMNRAEAAGIRAQGGGLRITGNADFRIEASIIAKNTSRVTAVGSTAPARGGGIQTSPDTARLEIIGSLITNNTAEGTQGHGVSGGGLDVNRPATIENTTIVNNSAVGHDGDAFSGGLAAVHPNDPKITLNNTTVARNQAVSNGSGSAEGGGIGGGPDVELGNTLLVGNSDASGDHPDCRGDLTSSSTSNGHNILGDNTGCGFTARLSDQVGTSSAPILADTVFDPVSLDDHGGGITIGTATLPMQTLALASSGPAVDEGDPNPPGSGGSCASEDQRGGARPADGNNDGSAVCDIGAFELGASLPGGGGSSSGGGSSGGGGAPGAPLELLLGLALTLAGRRTRFRR